jgi:hypothetical protein
VGGVRGQVNLFLFLWGVGLGGRYSAPMLKCWHAGRSVLFSESTSLYQCHLASCPFSPLCALPCRPVQSRRPPSPVPRPPSPVPRPPSPVPRPLSSPGPPRHQPGPPGCPNGGRGRQAPAHGGASAQPAAAGGPGRVRDSAARRETEAAKGHAGGWVGGLGGGGRAGGEGPSSTWQRNLFWVGMQAPCACV